MKKLTRTVLAVCAAGLLGSAAQAQVTTDPYLFESPSFGAADGTFEWDTFAGAFAGPHAADVGSAGMGAASLTPGVFTPVPMDGPPFGLVTGSSNLYSGGNTGSYDIELTGLADAEAFTTVVLQIAYIPGEVPFATSLQLNGSDATERVDRGTANGVLHGLVGSPNDTTYLWAQWQVAAGEDYVISFDTANHTNLAAVRIDYINDAAVVDAVAAGAVPEPTGLALLIGGAALCTARRRR
ncbi:PEP-CTERM sorting domain-containing protein [Phycisphaeraceae bacterium D3-23]